MKKILFVADARQIHTAKWVDYFLDQGYDVHVATFAQNRTKATNVYSLSKQEKNLKGGNFHYLLSIKDLADIIKQIEPEMINAHFSYSMGFIALLALKLSGVECKFSVVCHGTDVLIPPHPTITEKINKYVLSNSDKIYAVSHQIREKIINFGVDENRIFTGQYGIKIQPKDLPKDIDIISNRTYEPNSQIDLLLEYLQELNALNLKIVFVLPDVTDEEYDHLVNKYPKITFYKPMPYEQMLDLVNRSKIYISATKSDGTSLSLMEAMELSCIPLVSDIISNRSLILDGVNGFMFYKKDQFLEKLQYILDNYPFLAEQIPPINKDLIKQIGDYDTQMKKIEEFLIN